MELDYNIIIQLGAALAIGMLIGIERGWSGREHDEEERMAGLRTFSLVGLLGGISAQISSSFGGGVLAVALVMISLLSIVSYVLDSKRTEDTGNTTEFAMILTFLLGAWANLGYYIYALSTTVVVITLLSLKPTLHRWVRNLETKEIYAGIKLLLISVVLLPLLPNQGYGPWEVLNPYWIWWMVVLISGLSFTGYIAIKKVGNRVGTLVTAITGGLVSSTAVTFSLAQFAKEQPRKTLFMGGVLISNSIMLIRVPVEVMVVNSSLLQQLWIPISLMFLGMLLGGAWLWRSWNDSDSGPKINLENPLKLSTAIQFGLFLALILVLAEGMKQWFGDQGIYALALVSGLMDVDAITLSLSRLALNDISAQVATMGIVIAAVVNTLVKGVYFTIIVGLRKSIELIVVMLIAILPGLISAYLLLV
ncbi:MAG: MgtC/SapB family protein [Bacteroidota bacterium]